MTEVPDFLKT